MVVMKSQLRPLKSIRGRSVQRNTGFWDVLANPDSLTFDNYEATLVEEGANNLFDSVISSFAIAIPATIIPIGKRSGAKIFLLVSQIRNTMELYQF